MNLFLVLLCLFVSLTATGSDQQHYNEGKGLAQSETNLPDQNQIASLPGFGNTTAPEQKYFTDPASLTNDASHLLAQGNEQSTDMAKQVSGSLQQAANQRQMYLFDEYDPLIKSGDYIVSHALDEIHAKEEPRSTSLQTNKSLHQCEEAREPTYYKGNLTRHVWIEEPPITTHHMPIKVQTTINVQGLSWMQNAQHEYNWLSERNFRVNYNIFTQSLFGSNCVSAHLPPYPGFNPGHFYMYGTDYTYSIQSMDPFQPPSVDSVISVDLVETHPNVHLTKEGLFVLRPERGNWFENLNVTVEAAIKYQPPITEADIRENIEDGCQFLEQKVDQGLCEYVEEKILEGPETRHIEPLDIYRDWWKKQRTYKCAYPSRNNCGELRRRGCTQTKSDCKTKIEDTCVEYVQTFECEERQESVQGSSLTGPAPFCLDSNCDEHGWGPNQDFAEAISKLAIFKEMQTGMSKNPIVIFKGEARSCRRDCLSFRDCCGTGKGWGKTFGYSCSGEERQLSKLRQQKKCVFVGTFCVEKKLGVCIRKRSTFCCFGAKLVRIVQEQGRGQLGLGWGDPKCPDCRGLTVDEISRVDFSKLDLREVFEDIMAKAIMVKTKTPDFQKFTVELQHNVTGKMKGLQERFSHKSKGDSDAVF